MNIKSYIRMITVFIAASFAHSSWGYEDFYVAFTADPQLTWACAPGSVCKQHAHAVEAQGIVSNRWQADSINKLIAQYGSAFKGVIVNGDLTAFGHKQQFKQYLTYFRNRIKAPVYEGLGNHDYSNNIDDCFNNNCARRMVSYLYNRLRKKKGRQIKSYDFNASKVYFKLPYLRQDFKGSLSYSFDIQGVHFIQLNFHPGYQRSFESWNFAQAKMEQYHITNAFDWLKKDLNKAYKEGKTIIVNLHDFNQHIKTADKNKLKKLLLEYKAAGLFWGHIHSRVGRTNEAGPVPTFRCGSSPYNSYLLAHFQKNKLTEVSVMKSDYGTASVQEVYLLERMS